MIIDIYMYTHTHTSLILRFCCDNDRSKVCLNSESIKYYCLYTLQMAEKTGKMTIDIDPIVSN